MIREDIHSNAEYNGYSLPTLVAGAEVGMISGGEGRRNASGSNREVQDNIKTNVVFDITDPILIGRQLRGYVKWFSSENTYGFIEVPGMRKDVFVHSSHIVYDPRYEEGPIEAGQAVMFWMAKDIKGRPRAVDVTDLDGEPLKPVKKFTWMNNREEKTNMINSSQSEFCPVQSQVVPHRLKNSELEQHEYFVGPGSSRERVQFSRHRTHVDPRPCEGSVQSINEGQYLASTSLHVSRPTTNLARGYRSVLSSESNQIIKPHMYIPESDETTAAPAQVYVVQQGHPSQREQSELIYTGGENRRLMTGKRRPVQNIYGKDQTVLHVQDPQGSRDSDAASSRRRIEPISLDPRCNAGVQEYILSQIERQRHAAEGIQADELNDRTFALQVSSRGPRSDPRQYQNSRYPSVRLYTPPTRSQTPGCVDRANKGRTKALTSTQRYMLEQDDEMERESLKPYQRQRNDQYGSARHESEGYHADIEQQQSLMEAQRLGERAVMPPLPASKARAYHHTEVLRMPPRSLRSQGMGSEGRQQERSGQPESISIKEKLVDEHKLCSENLISNNRGNNPMRMYQARMASMESNPQVPTFPSPMMQAHAEVDFESGPPQRQIEKSRPEKANDAPRTAARTQYIPPVQAQLMEQISNNAPRRIASGKPPAVPRGLGASDPSRLQRKQQQQGVLSHAGAPEVLQHEPTILPRQDLSTGKKRIVAAGVRPYPGREPDYTSGPSSHSQSQSLGQVRSHSLSNMQGTSSGYTSKLTKRPLKAENNASRTRKSSNLSQHSVNKIGKPRSRISDAVDRGEGKNLPSDDADKQVSPYAPAQNLAQHLSKEMACLPQQGAVPNALHSYPTDQHAQGNLRRLSSPESFDQGAWVTPSDYPYNISGVSMTSMMPMQPMYEFRSPGNMTTNNMMVPVQIFSTPQGQQMILVSPLNYPSQPTVMMPSGCPSTPNHPQGMFSTTYPQTHSTPGPMHMSAKLSPAMGAQPMLVMAPFPAANQAEIPTPILGAAEGRAIESEIRTRNMIEQPQNSSSKETYRVGSPLQSHGMYSD